VRKRPRTDGNQNAIVAALRDAGCHVIVLTPLGEGIPDLLVSTYSPPAGRVLALLVEVKTATGTLTPDEAAWWAAYPADGPAIVARSAEDVLRWFGRVS
jgi:hypothetical protein